MIYLFTGVPGAGKTLQVVSMLAKSKDFKNRPLYVDGIKGLKIPHEKVPEGETIQTWPDWAPTGAVIVVDECQRIFRPRPSGSKVPEYVSELETHRHRGLDFLLITQNPRLIDVHLRSLIEHHTHFSKTNLGFRRKLEWSTGGAKDPESRTNIREALVSVYRLDKSCYGLYESSEEHTNIKTAKSKLLYILPFSFGLLGYGIWQGYQLMDKMQQPPEAAAVAEKAAPAQSAAPVVQNQSGQYPPLAASAPQPEQPQKPHISADDYKPAIDGQPWTAPLYNSQNKAIKTMPYPVACVKSANKCTCYTDQATPIKGMDKDVCIDYVENGIYNPYKDRQTAINTVSAVKQTTDPVPAQVAVLGGKIQQNLMYDGYVQAGEQFR
ncbi:zonular occludens toxin domain-containing protein [Neisseria dentiae]|uniref:zonular occludens toxin domain-containing protein n=1 Tax=Neisseria dentiae TaxID=194197 RepID=UPI0035A0F494